MNPCAEVMPLVRRYAYGSSGTPPLGYSERRDALIALQLVRRYGLDDVCLAVKGLKAHRPVTLRWLLDAERFLEAMSAGRQVEEQEADYARAQMRLQALLEP